VRGLHDGGVAATLKHFPGLGAAVTNTDLASSVVDVTAPTLRATDFPPFIAGIGAAVIAFLNLVLSRRIRIEPESCVKGE
jgi:beta-N-acetylhexosaminidase